MRRQCSVCRRPRGFVTHGKRKNDKQHDLCRRCWRSILDRLRVSQ